MRPEPEQRRAELAGAAFLLLLCVPLVLYGLGSYGLVNGDEEIYHVIAAHMVDSGNWLHLDFYGEHRVYDTFMNAPIQYWVRASLISLAGNNFWTMRLGSALFAVASVLLTHRVVSRLSGPRAGLLAGAVQLTTLQFVYLHSARTGELEPVLAFLLTAAAWAFARGVLEGRSFVPLHLCLVLMLNLKLPTVAIPLLGAAFCFALLPATRPHLRRFVTTGVVVLPLGLVWHVSQVIALWDPFVEVVAKMGDQASGARDQKLLPGELAGLASGPLQNIGFYANTLWYGAFPWVLVYPLAVAGVLRTARDRPERIVWHVIALHTLALFVFYVVVDKHHRWYIVPAYPLLSAFVGAWLASLWQRTPRLALQLAAAGVMALCGWVGLDVLGFNPFADRAYRVPMELSWRRPGGVSPWLAVVISASALAALCHVIGKRLPERLPGVLAGSLALALFVVAVARVLPPLRHVGFRSETARFHAALEEQRPSGDESVFPRTAPVRFNWETRFYFDRRYEIVREPDRSYRLYEKGDPRAEADRLAVFSRTVRERRRQE